MRNRHDTRVLLEAALRSLSTGEDGGGPVVLLTACTVAPSLLPNLREAHQTNP